LKQRSKPVARVSSENPTKVRNFQGPNLDV
jgi:hypothetical protein